MYLSKSCHVIRICGPSIVRFTENFSKGVSKSFKIYSTAASLSHKTSWESRLFSIIYCVQINGNQSGKHTETWHGQTPLRTVNCISVENQFSFPAQPIRTARVRTGSRTAPAHWYGIWFCKSPLKRIQNCFRNPVELL